MVKVTPALTPGWARTGGERREVGSDRCEEFHEVDGGVDEQSLVRRAVVRAAPRLNQASEGMAVDRIRDVKDRRRFRRLDMDAMRGVEGRMHGRVVGAGKGRIEGWIGGMEGLNFSRIRRKRL